MLSDELLSQLAKYQYSVARGGDRVYKDECVFCFDTPYTESGLFVCLSTLLGACSKHLPLHVQRTKKLVFLHLKKIKKEFVKTQEGSPPEKKPTKLAIAVEGGFDVDKDKVEYEDVNSLIITDGNGSVAQQHLLPEPNLPLNAQLSIAAVLSHQGSCMQNEVQAWEDKRIISKHAIDLQQLDNGVKVPPRGWKCCMCDLTENLWLNLTDGTILCGRRYFDGTGGNNHALEYYQNTKYPLAVKLGTISAEGGDVFSYDEDDMVEDPKLVEHLKHFGINVADLKQTDKTMTELEIEANMSLKAEWDTIQEAGEKLTPLFGPGYTGMVNLGNSCYMNSLMQTVFSMEEFQERFANRAEGLFNEGLNNDPSQDFNVQMAKLGLGLLSGNYSTGSGSECEAQGIKPQMIKHLIGQGHPEFSTNHQQDVHEYFAHLMDVIEKNETENAKLQHLFKFQYEDRIECATSHKVAYKKRDEMIWALPVPLDAATNIFEYQQFEQLRAEAERTKQLIVPENVVRLNIPMQACLDSFFSPDCVEDFYSTAIKGKTTAQKMTRFASFPDYLVIQLQKFTISDDWTPKKLDVLVDMQDTLDLTPYVSIGLQQHEEALPEDTGPEAEAVPEPEINNEFVSMLEDMGFPREACRKAVYHTNNQGVEAAMNWVFEHSQDADFATPLNLNPSQQQSQQVFQADPSAVTMIMSMGFTDIQAKKALKKTNNNLEAAAEWIFTHGDELDETDPEESGSQTSTSSPYYTGEGRYKLIAFISHMGTSTSCGHYVAHIIKDGRWVIFNDRKVASSVNPPKDMGYLYFYKRTTPRT